MSLLSRYLDGAYVTWLSSAVSCCGQQVDDKPRRSIERPMQILHHQPSLVPPPRPEPQDNRSSSYEWMSRTKSFASRASTRGSFSVRRKLNTYNGMRRPHISAPTDFRHVQNALPRRTGEFRPLELSIYVPENQLSPLPLFSYIEDQEQLILSPPPAALLHTRSESALSNFSVPRKPVIGHKSIHGRMEGLSVHTTPSSTSSAWMTHSVQPPPCIPESPSAEELINALQEELPYGPPHRRHRANTEPSRIINRQSKQVDRVKLALQEKMELERQLRDIDSVIEERRSLYLSSRANSVYALSEEPMPHLTTSELERLPRPMTAPAKPTVHIPIRAKSFDEATATFTARERALPPPPPLPLFFQTAPPPLRKKKSFSRVSSWLFPEHSRSISLESITNTPKPVKSREGFYQCVDTKTVGTSVLTVSTLGSEIDDPTTSTSWSPTSSPSSRGRKDDAEVGRVLTVAEKEEGIVVTKEFGTVEVLPIRMSRVGVAF